MQNFDKLLKLANSLNQFAEANEKISLDSLNDKLAKANYSYPEDQTIGILKGVIAKISSRKMDISRSELKDLYQKLNTGNSKFAQIFSDELGIPTVSEEVLAPVIEQSPFQSLDLDSVREEMVDPIFASALDQAFGGTRLPYNASLAKRAVEVVSSRLDLFGLSAKCAVSAGNGSYFVCTASFETPKGLTSILVPVVFEDSKVAMADSFVGNAMTGEISRINVQDYLAKEAGKNLQVNASQILDILVSTASDEISSVDLAIIKMKQDDQPESYFSPGIIGQSIDAVNPNLVLNLEVKQAPEYQELSGLLENNLASACYAHGQKTVQAGRNNIESRLGKFGITAISTAVSANDSSSITYDVSINGGSTAFRVPISIINRVAMLPEIIICQGSIKEFSQDGLQELLASNSFDGRVAAAASPLYGNRPSDLVAIIRKAMSQNNFVMAEDALNTLAEGDDKKAYSIGLLEFSNGLKPKTNSAPTPSCSKPVMTKHSQHPICGHTNLPIHKIYVDKYGLCRPLHRQASEDSSDGSSEVDKNLLFGNK